MTRRKLLENDTFKVTVPLANSVMLKNIWTKFHMILVNFEGKAVAAIYKTSEASFTQHKPQVGQT